MCGQEEYSPFDASSQTRVLTPSKSHEAFPVESKKRKRERGAIEDLLDDPFIVKPHPSTVFHKPHSLSPVALISRMYIPLSYIDTLSPLGTLPASRLFEAHVKILELEERLGNIPMVLVAQLDDGKSYFVVERVEKNLYVLCKLGSWVKLTQLCAEAVVSKHQHQSKIVVTGPEISSSLRENECESYSMLGPSKYTKKKRLAIEAIQSMVKRPSRNLSPTSQEVAPICFPSNAVMEFQPQEGAGLEAIQEEVVVWPMASEIFDNIRSQYFEALYLSKASLAYFAKGPLSRARAAFHLDYDSTLNMNDLIEFLESLILPANVVDKKYKDSLPNFLSSLIMLDGSDDETMKITKFKKLKSKKIKPGKNGLYPAEDTYISRWWGSHGADTDIDAPRLSKEEAIRKRVAQLRIRETQLQMIIILETLALRPLAISLIDHHGELPLIGQKDGTSSGKAVTRSKLNKPLDLAVLIEVHVDRICIWQSVAAEEERTTSTVGEVPNVVSRPKGSPNTHDHAADMLREFCIEVIVPFFSARLPEQCRAISRKLGGPVVASPMHTKLKESASSSAVPSRPGAITKRNIATKARRSLRRVLTDERRAREGSRGTSGAISLIRSAMTPTIPALKIEGSETSLLSSIPSAEIQAMPVSRGGVLKSKKFSQREIDLNSLASVSDTKVKKANIEAELKDAISALKRPNRQLAGKLQVETAERRVASASVHSRKSKKPTQNLSFQRVQIISTPKGNRQREMAGDSHLAHRFEQDHELQVIPASSIAMEPLPMTSAANIQEPDAMPLSKTTPARSNTGNMEVSVIFGTLSQGQAAAPSRLSSKVPGTGSLSHCELSPSPLGAKCSSEQQIFDMPVPFTQEIKCTPSKIVKICATPSKTGETNALAADASSTSLSRSIETAGIEKTRNTGNCGILRERAGADHSIYKSLGWDDYDDIA